MIRLLLLPVVTAIAVGISDQKGARNAPTILNSVFSKSYFWDGRAASLEEQAKQPLVNANEMGMQSEAALMERVSLIQEYRSSFRKVFPRDGVTIDPIVSAIAAFERTLRSNNSPFDRFIRGDRDAMSATQKRGWELFKGKAKCLDCHRHSPSKPFFHDAQFHNTGIRGKDLSVDEMLQRANEVQTQNIHDLAHEPKFSDLGRFLVTRNRKDLGAFRTPTLRDVELTGPYMHDGSIKTLLDVVRFYNRGGVSNPIAR